MTNDIFERLDDTATLARSQAASAQSQAKILEDIRETLRRTVGTDLPEWRWAKVDGRDKAADLSDREFARRRLAIRDASRDIFERLAQAADFAKAILGSCRDKVARVQKLKAQAAKLPDSAERTVALGRIQATTIAANAMYKRLWLVVGDFALLRKQVASRLVNLTTILADEFPEGHPALADAFAGDKRDIRNSLGLLAEMDERIYAKKGMKA